MLHFKKKAVVATAAGIGAVAVGTGAWAYVSTIGSGGGTASATVATNTLSLNASAAIVDLDTPATITIKGTSSNKNRHINKVTVALGSLPDNCDPTWFSLSGGGSTAVSWTGYTFLTTNEETVADTNLTITLNNSTTAAQDACLVNNLPLTVTAS